MVKEADQLDWQISNVAGQNEIWQNVNRVVPGGKTVLMYVTQVYPVIVSFSNMQLFQSLEL